MKDDNGLTWNLALKASYVNLNQEKVELVFTGNFELLTNGSEALREAKEANLELQEGMTATRQSSKKMHIYMFLV